MSTLRAEPGWADVLLDSAADAGTADRLIRQLNAASVASLAFCRLLERWGRGDAAPSRPRSPASSSPSAATCSSWSPSARKAAPGTALPARPS
jgi:hypothetical protein